MALPLKKKAHSVSCEGNLFIISVLLAKDHVLEAWSTGKMIQNMNYLLGAVVSPDHSFFIQRRHCLCNAGHALAATRALEQLMGLDIPQSARLVRNIAHGLQFLLDHLTHFYLFHLADWFDLDTALRATPEGTAAFARAYHPERTATATFYQEAYQRLAALAAGQKGASVATPDGRHPGYAASPEASLFVLSHAQSAVTIRAKLTQAQSLLQGTHAADATWHVGGLPPTAGSAPGSNPDLSPGARANCAALLRECQTFIEDVFLDDILLTGRIYRDWATIGRSDAFLSWGEFPNGDGQAPLFPRGVFSLRERLQARPATPEAVSEELAPDWSTGDAARYRLRFGPTEPAYQWRNADFCWFSAPRYAGQACEVGPVARLLGAYARGDTAVRAVVDTTLTALDLPLSALNSTLGRMLARGLEAVIGIRSATAWLQDLAQCLSQENAALRVPWEMPDAGEGLGLAELPRGALVHHLRLQDRRIVVHEALVPSLWNFSPRGSDGSLGPLEQALRSTPVADPAHPIELLRVIHSFDPCNACVVRIEDRDTGRVLHNTVQ